jgi:hypothetical protein
MKIPYRPYLRMMYIRDGIHTSGGFPIHEFAEIRADSWLELELRKNMKEPQPTMWMEVGLIGVYNEVTVPWWRFW